MSLQGLAGVEGDYKLFTILAESFQKSPIYTLWPHGLAGPDSVGLWWASQLFCQPLQSARNHWSLLFHSIMQTYHRMKKTTKTKHKRQKQPPKIQLEDIQDWSTANRNFWSSNGGKGKQRSPGHPHSEFTEEIPHQEEMILDMNNYSQIHFYLANLKFFCFQFILDCGSELHFKRW